MIFAWYYQVTVQAIFFIKKEIAESFSSFFGKPNKNEKNFFNAKQKKCRRKK